MWGALKYACICTGAISVGTMKVWTKLKQTLKHRARLLVPPLVRINAEILRTLLGKIICINLRAGGGVNYNYGRKGQL